MTVSIHHPLKNQVPAVDLVISAAIIGDEKLLREIPLAEIPAEVRQLAVRLAQQGEHAGAASLLKAA